MVCKENLSGDLAEGFFSSGVKERLRLLVQTAIRKGVDYWNVAAEPAFC